MDIKLKKKPFIVRNKFYLLGGTVLLLLFAYMLFVSTGPSRQSLSKEDATISEVKHDKFLEYLDMEGIARPGLIAKLNSMESGIVERIVTNDGSILKKGDTILLLANPELLQTVSDERDKLEKQRIAHSEKLLQMEQKTSELKRNTLKTRYELSRLSKQYELDKEEYALGIKSKAQLNISSEEYQYNLENTRLLLEELKQDSLKNIIQRDLIRGEMDLGEKQYLRSRERLEKLVVRAPIEGQLSFLSVIPGEHVQASSNIGELKDISNFKVIANVSEYYIDRISIGLSAYITFKEEKYPLTISRINPEIKDRNFEIDLLFENKYPDNIRVGQTFRIHIELGQAESALVINKGNFYTETGGQWVFKLNKEGTKAIKTPVTIGRQNPLQYEILDGLQQGDKVIVSGYNSFGNVQELILK